MLRVRFSIISKGLTWALAAAPSLGLVAGKPMEAQPFAVVGVISSERSGSGIAVVRTAGHVSALRVGSRIGASGSPTIVEVTQQYVVFEAPDGSRMTVRVGDAEEPAGARGAPGIISRPSLVELSGVEAGLGKARITAALRDHLVGDRLAEVLMQAAAVPYFEDGTLRGFRLSLIDEGSVFDRVGLKDGDVVVSINDSPVTDVASTIGLLRSLRGESEVSFSIIRGGQTQRLVIEVI